MKMNGPEKFTKVLENMGEEEIQTLESCMSTLGEIDIPVIDSVNRDFYNLVEAGPSMLNTEGMDFLESALMKVVGPVKASQV
jgi:flagellar motor switch protein FliG